MFPWCCCLVLILVGGCGLGDLLLFSLQGLVVVLFWFSCFAVGGFAVRLIVWVICFIGLLLGCWLLGLA